MIAQTPAAAPSTVLALASEPVQAKPVLPAAASATPFYRSLIGLGDETKTDTPVAIVPAAPQAAPVLVPVKATVKGWFCSFGIDGFDRQQAGPGKACDERSRRQGRRIEASGFEDA